MMNMKVNQVQREVIESVDGISIKTLLSERLEEQEMTQRELAEKTGIGENMISAFCTNREGVKIGYSHILSIMIVLKLSRIEQLLVVSMPDETKEAFNKEYAEKVNK